MNRTREEMIDLLLRDIKEAGERYSELLEHPQPHNTHVDTAYLRGFQRGKASEATTVLLRLGEGVNPWRIFAAVAVDREQREAQS